MEQPGHLYFDSFNLHSSHNNNDDDDDDDASFEFVVSFPSCSPITEVESCLIFLLVSNFLFLFVLGCPRTSVLRRSD